MTLKLTPYITLHGKGKEAIAFYEQAISAELQSLVTYGEMPQMPNTFTEEMKNLVANARLKVGSTELYLSDAPFAGAVESGNAVTICITTDDVEHSRKIFEALAQEGQVNLPFKEEVFSPGFGDVTDKFGITFQIYTELEEQ